MLESAAEESDGHYALMKPQIFGVVNITEDSFSDGGRYLEPTAAVSHGLRLAADGADVIDLGPASTHPDAREVSPQEEIRRLDPVVENLMAAGLTISVDSFRPETQRWAAARGVAFLNDTQGFPDPSVYHDLAQANCKLVVMHSIQRAWKTERIVTDPDRIYATVEAFFTQRIKVLQDAGIDRERLIIDPGMGFFLGSNPEPSLRMLTAISRLKQRFRLPMMICVSRKSFLKSITGRDTPDLGPATLAAELYAAAQRVDLIRTHDVRALSDALNVTRALLGCDV
jgi:dihydropteroate synthase type 2